MESDVEMKIRAQATVLAALCTELGIEPWDLDDDVHDLKSQEASEINNSDLCGQLAYFLEKMSPESAVVRLLEIGQLLEAEKDE